MIARTESLRALRAGTPVPARRVGASAATEVAVPAATSVAPTHYTVHTLPPNASCTVHTVEGTAQVEMVARTDKVLYSPTGAVILRIVDRPIGFRS